MSGAMPEARATVASGGRDLVAQWLAAHSTTIFIVSETEIDCLQAAADKRVDDPDAFLLLRKLETARLLHALRMPLDVVALNASVEYTFDGGRVRKRRIVRPGALAGADDVSGASGIGAGLLGLQVGQTIRWPGEDGQLGDLQVLSVGYAGGEMDAVFCDEQSCS